jgi:WD40 repeat protein/GTPase SAR1 family protein/DNA-directed RNA polymerase subunit RPC12/RpoP
MSSIPEEEIIDATKQLSFYERKRPDVVSLALLASPARRIEAGLLRILRLKLAHHFPAEKQPMVGTEAALWFSSLVESRGLDSLTLLPGVLHLLREQLRGKVELLEEVHAIIESCHREIPPIINWEEELIYYSLNPAFDERQRFELLRQVSLSAKKALRNKGGHGFEERINEISRRIPQQALQHPDFRQLLSESQQRIKKFRSFSISTGENVAGAEENIVSLPRKTVQIKMGDHELLVGEIIGQADFHIDVPDISPLTLQASETLDGTDAVSYVVPKSGVVSIPAPRPQIYLYALDGNWYEIKFPAPQPPANHFAYDVFLSHGLSRKDRKVVRDLAERLKSDGVKVWFDEWEIEAGDVFDLKIRAGLEQSRTLVLAMSINTSKQWSTFESQFRLFSDPANKQRRFFPLRLDDHQIPETLRMFAYVDWRKPSDGEYQKLLEAIRRNYSEQSTPATGKTEEVLTGHAAPVLSAAVTPDGRHVVSGSWDDAVRVWYRNSGHPGFALEGHTGYVTSVAAGDLKIFSGSWDGTLKVWDAALRTCDYTLEGHTAPVLSIALAPDQRLLVSGSADQTIKIWEPASTLCLRTLDGHVGLVLSVTLTLDGKQIVSGGEDEKINVWEMETGRLLFSLAGHTGAVLSVAVTPDRRYAVSGSTDRTIRIWDLSERSNVRTLEGHSEAVTSVVVTPEGRHIVSGSSDGSIRVWELESGMCLNVLEGRGNSVLAVALTPDGRQIVSGDSDNNVRLIEFPPVETPAESTATETYTSAKVLLLGDSGVGKSGLALRLIEDRFEPTESTHGVRVNRVVYPGDAEARGEREIWFWDMAGQFDYRLTRHLFMDDISLALIVFDPGDENPLESLSRWERTLRPAAGRSFKKFLVAGRQDRGSLRISRQVLKKYMREQGYDQFFETSAKDGTGCEELREAIVNSIPWDEIPWTTSPRSFYLLREEIIKLKEEGVALLRMPELKQQLEMRMTGRLVTLEELTAVVSSMSMRGLIWPLRFGDIILFQPEVLNLYSSAVIRLVRSNPDETGSVLEEDVLSAKLGFPAGFKRLLQNEEAIILRSIYELFIERGICFREATERGTMLVFPSYFRRERPEPESPPAPLVTYHFNGALDEIDEIYATLVVRLNNSLTLRKINLWRFAADFETSKKERLGFELRKVVGDEAELHLFFEEEVADDTKIMFTGYVHDHLLDKANNVQRIRHYSCPTCGEPVTSGKAVRARLERGFKDIVCAYCESRIPLWDVIEEAFLSPSTQKLISEMQEQASSSMENESQQLILLGHAFTIVAEAGQIFRPIWHSDLGLDGEIEFKNDRGEASGRRIYLQLKSSDYSYPLKRRSDGKEILDIKEPRYLTHWRTQNSPVMLVLRDGEGAIRWMNVTDYLRQQQEAQKQIVFEGEPFDALSVVRMRDVVLGARPGKEVGDSRISQHLDNESHELILIGRMYSIVGQAGHIFRQTPNSAWGINGEIEFKGYEGNASVKRVHLHLKSGDSYLHKRKRDGKEIFVIKNPRHVEYWLSLNNPVMLVIRTSDGAIRWMNVTNYLKRERNKELKVVKQIVFEGEPLTAESISKMRGEALK